MPKPKRNNHSLFLIGGVALLVFLMVAFGREYVGNVQIQYEIRQQEKLREELEAQKLSTLDLIGTLSNEYYLEREGRSKQGLVKPGEEVIVITDTAADEEVAPVRYGITTLDEVSYAKRWFYYFFDHERYDYLETL